ncbi:MAG: hypothetical protein QNJ57_12470 [Flavobacteriaceae bacterium]|nr:hypothetical protein [Flavobacteriaceae bacterium]
MDELHKIFNQINRITTTLETKYPELYRSLNENPLTIPATDHPDIDIAIMKDYLESLKQLLKHYVETHQNSA